MNSSVRVNNASFGGGGDGPLHVIEGVELYFWFFIYGMIAFLAVFGNTLVIYVILTRPKMRTVTNYFILNLAVGDLMTGMLAIPFKFQAALLQQWYLPHFMCQLVPYIETVALSVSVFTLVGSAVDRFRAVVYPHKTRIGKTDVRTIVMVIWAFSLTLSLPYGMFHQTRAFVPFVNATNAWPVPHDRLDEFAELLVWQCLPVYMFERWWNLYNVYLTIVQYFGPLIIVDGIYCVLAYKVWTVDPVTTPGSTGAQLRCVVFERSRRRVIKMLVMVVAVFTFCWLPYETYLVMNELRPKINEFYYINVIFFCSHWLAMSNSCLNPIIYALYNEKFQREYKVVLMKWLGMDHYAGVPQQIEEDAGSAMVVQASPMRNDSRFSDCTMDPSSFENGRMEMQTLKLNSCHQYIASELGKFD